MNEKEFKKAFASCIVKFGFTKTGGSYCQTSDDVICVVGLQKSNFEDAYYVNVGYIIRSLHPDLNTPRFNDGDIRSRFVFVTNAKQVELLDPVSLSSEDELESMIRENVASLVEGRVSIPGLKSLLNNHPILLNQTSLRAKKSLGCEFAT